jgi:hypothetical protein
VRHDAGNCFGDGATNRFDDEADLYSGASLDSMTISSPARARANTVAAFEAASTSEMWVVAMKT